MTLRGLLMTSRCVLMTSRCVFMTSRCVEMTKLGVVRMARGVFIQGLFQVCDLGRELIESDNFDSDNMQLRMQQVCENYMARL